jgi:secreted trypsin-like serine protease
MRTTRFTLYAGALALFILSCTSGLMVLDGSGDVVGESRGIYNGAPPDAVHHDAVVSLHELSRKGDSVYVSPFCTGTLITDTVVLTAAHCLDDANGGNNFRTMDPSRLAIYVGDEPAVDIIDHLYLVTETLIHTSYDRNALRNDIALVRLATPVSEAAPIANLPAAQGFTAADAGLVLNFAGFGQDEFGNSGVKLQGDWPITGLGCAEPECPDAGDDATQISYDQIDGGPCFGDSGGPAFVDRAGTWYVGGITSYGDSYCAYYGVSTRADAYETWIGDFTGQNPPPDCSADSWCNPECAEGDDPDCATPPDCSADGWCNPDCDAADDPDCVLPPDDCGDGVCGVGESCDGRDATTECSADCDGKTTGKPSGRYCYVEGVCEGAGCP